MNPMLVFFEGIPHLIIKQSDDWGIQVFDLASPPKRLWGTQTKIPSSIRTHIDPNKTQECPSPGQLLTKPLVTGDTWSAMTKRSLARFEAFFLIAEDPQRRLDARAVVTLAHQVSLVRHILDSPGRRRVLIGDEVGLGKTVVAGLIIQELLEANPGLRVLYLAPARLVANVGREFTRLALRFRQWKTQDSDARLDTDSLIIASIHRAVHPNHFGHLLKLQPWDLIVVDECHHLSDWGEGGGDPVMKYRLVKALVDAQLAESCLLLLSGTPHQAHVARFENLLRLLQAPGESQSVAAGRVIYRTKDDVRDWEGKPLFPTRQVNPPIIVDLDSNHRDWLFSIHQFFTPSTDSRTQATKRAAGWKCAQSLQWATSSPNAGLGFLVRQALRAGWTLQNNALKEGIEAMRPYRSGPANEPVNLLYDRLNREIGSQSSNNDVEDIEEDFIPSQDIDDSELAALIAHGVKLVRAPIQLKWERLWKEVLQPSGREKVVMFAQPIETVLALASWLQTKTGQRPAIIIGGQSDHERNQQVANFQSLKGPQFLISSRAGGEGINLQISRRLVHLDVPWNPMEMEQRVGRVHRFGSRETVLVDTLVVSNSREANAWAVARNRLFTIAQTLVATDRFETVFSRVMCLIPPEELQTVLINNPASSLIDTEVEKLSALVDCGFKEWQIFHDKYAANQKQIRDQPSGLARWNQLKDFLCRYDKAEPATGIAKTRFIQSGGKVITEEVPADVIKLSDGSRCFVGDYEGGLFSGQSEVAALGLNIPFVADFLYDCANPSIATGAAHMRWVESQTDFRTRLGDDVVILAFARQLFRIDSIGGNKEVGLELLAYAVSTKQTMLLVAKDREELFNMNKFATVRMRPTQSSLFDHAAKEELRLVDELRRPCDEDLRKGIRYAIWPILALHMVP